MCTGKIGQAQITLNKVAAMSDENDSNASACRHSQNVENDSWGSDLNTKTEYRSVPLSYVSVYFSLGV